MFRGLTRREHLFTLAMIGGIAALLGWRATQTNTSAPVRISGAVVQHEPGEILPPAAPEDVDLQPVADDAPSALAGLVDGRIDINVASVEVLEALPGIGPVKAASIVGERGANGRFASVADLERVHGIGHKTIERLEPMVFVAPAQVPAPESPAAVSPPVAPTPISGASDSAIVRLNTATQEELESLTGIGPAKAAAILEYRRLNGPFRSVDQLTAVRGIGPVTLERNRHRLAAN